MSDPKLQTVLVVMGSIRAARRCAAITDWVVGLAEETGGASFERLDLRDWPLPADDEPEIPMTGRYRNEHTQRWSEKIAAADGFLIVTPEYNSGYPAALKNALDHLYAEWGGKPVAFVTYGGHGGGDCAGQLAQVARKLKMRLVETMPAMVLDDAVIHGGPLDPARDLAPHADEIRGTIAELRDALTSERAAA